MTTENSDLTKTVDSVDYLFFFFAKNALQIGPQQAKIKTAKNTFTSDSSTEKMFQNENTVYS